MKLTISSMFSSSLLLWVGWILFTSSSSSSSSTLLTVEAAAVSTSTTTTTRLYLKYNLSSARIPTSISDHTANLVSNRFVYLAGGCNATLGNTYNADDNEFQCDSISDALYRYDLQTQVFATLPNMPVPRYRHAAAAVNNDQLWIFGGRDLNDEIIAQVDVFEMELNRWITVGNLSDTSFLTSDQASFAYGNYAYVVGGYYSNYTAASLVYRVNTLTALQSNSNLSSSSSSLLEIMAPMQQGRGDIAFTFDETYAYIVGGFTDVNNFCDPLSSLERYSFSDNTWTSLAPLQEARSDLLLAQIKTDNNNNVNNLLYALGGERQLPDICTLAVRPQPGERTLAVNDVEVYNATTTTTSTTSTTTTTTSSSDPNWTILASLPEHRFRFAGVVWNTDIYTFGGQSAFDASCNCYRTSNEVVTYIDETENVTIATTITTTTTSAAAARAVAPVTRGAATFMMMTTTMMTMMGATFMMMMMIMT